MKISIITISYNSVKTIEDTIQSVLSQSYANIEYIIIDGGSTDGTLDILKKYSDKISKVISEPDKGIYDAMNKGVALATGDVVGIINSDDFYVSDSVVANIVKKFEDTSLDACYGDIEYVDRVDSQKKVRKWVAGEYQKSKLYSGWIPPHPAFFVKREMYTKYGVFNLDFKIAADYELMLRFLFKGIKIEYVPQKLVYMREGGFSALSFKQRKRGWDELKKVWIVNGLPVPSFFILRRILYKINQFKL